MKRRRWIYHAIIIFLTAAALPSLIHAQQDAPSLAQRLDPIADAVLRAISGRKTPGAVVLIGHDGKVVYRHAFGYRSQSPKKIVMTEDTVFDLASLTKPIATATAVMQLAEQGALDIDSPVCRYWPAFGANGKTSITIRQLLTHYSGLRPDLPMRPSWSGYDAAMSKIVSEKPVLPPGSGYIYSDINFEVLGELVFLVSGLPLDEYCEKSIFTPLGMKDTGFQPPPDRQRRIAPTEFTRTGKACGKPHDPSCFRMGGVAGHAGLFSTADDLAVFASMLLNNGELNAVPVLTRHTVEKMTSPQSPAGLKQRGLGWDIEPQGVMNCAPFPRLPAYGHVGYTGTALWIDPLTKTFVIVLTNRVYPDGRGDVRTLRAEIKDVVAKAFGPLPAESSATAQGVLFSGRTGTMQDRAEQRSVLTGIDVLSREEFSTLSGLRIGLITNHTGVDSRGHRTIDLLISAPTVTLVALFSPEHGLSGAEDHKVPSTREPVTGLPVYSLYGTETRPTDKMLDGLDALVFDIQDAGARFYTYISTMGYAMEAAAKKDIAFYVLDRPNPINAVLVQGPVMDDNLKGFTGYFPLAVRHGMTVGELAGMFNAEAGIHAALHVVPMQGYHRSLWYDETGLPWVSPSPNLRSLTEAILYPGVALVEGANVSVGRGTDTPFEVLGAPWISSENLSNYLNNRGICGVRFEPTVFTPRSDIYRGKTCQGIMITVVDRQALDAASLGIGLVEALYRLYPRSFRIDETLSLVGSRDVLEAIKRGHDPRSLPYLWQPSLDRFLETRSKYLLY